MFLSQQINVGSLLINGQSKYLISKFISQGTEGHVFQASELTTKTVYALKVQQQLSESEKQFYEERIKHKFQNLVNVYEIFDHGKFKIIIMQMGQQNLYECIMQNQLNLSQIKQMFEQISNGVLELHSLNYAHRDLKPENILCSFPNQGELQLMICDFGLSKKSDDNHSRLKTKLIGTSYYMAPELVTNNYEIEYGTEVDIWSLGCIFYEIITKQPLFYGQSNQESIQQIVSITQKEIYQKLDSITQQQEQDLSSVVDLMKLMLKKKINTSNDVRPSAEEVLRWLRGNTNLKSRNHFQKDNQSRFHSLEKLYKEKQLSQIKSELQEFELWSLAEHYEKTKQHLGQIQQSQSGSLTYYEQEFKKFEKIVCFLHNLSEYKAFQQVLSSVQRLELRIAKDLEIFQHLQNDKFKFPLNANNSQEELFKYQDQVQNQIKEGFKKAYKELMSQINFEDQKQDQKEKSSSINENEFWMAEQKWNYFNRSLQLILGIIQKKKTFVIQPNSNLEGNPISENSCEAVQKSCQIIYIQIEEEVQKQIQKSTLDQASSIEQQEQQKQVCQDTNLILRNLLLKDCQGQLSILKQIGRGDGQVEDEYQTKKKQWIMNQTKLRAKIKNELLIHALLVAAEHNPKEEKWRNLKDILYEHFDALVNFNTLSSSQK